MLSSRCNKRVACVEDSFEGNVTPSSVAASAVAASMIGHIFRDAEGHVADTAANRELLQSVANDPAASLGADQYGNTWSARTLSDSTQAWTETRGGTIINAGVNTTPQPFNPQTGLKAQ